MKTESFNYVVSVVFLLEWEASCPFLIEFIVNQFFLNVALNQQSIPTVYNI